MCGVGITVRVQSVAGVDSAKIHQAESTPARDRALTVIPTPHIDLNPQVIPVKQPTMTSLATATTDQSSLTSTMGDQLAMIQQ